MRSRLATNWRLIIAVMVASMLVGAASATATTAVRGVFADSSGNQHMIIAGGVRCCPWRAVSDDRHKPINLTATGRNGQILLTFPQSKSIGTLVVTPDETLVRKGYSAGARVTKRSALVYCARYGQPVNCRRLAGSTANLMVFGIMGA